MTLEQLRGKSAWRTSPKGNWLNISVFCTSACRFVCFFVLFVVVVVVFVVVVFVVVVVLHILHIFYVTLTTKSSDRFSETATIQSCLFSCFGEARVFVVVVSA